MTKKTYIKPRVIVFAADYTGMIAASTEITASDALGNGSYDPKIEINKETVDGNNRTPNAKKHNSWSAWDSWD